MVSIKTLIASTILVLITIVSANATDVFRIESYGPANNMWEAVLPSAYTSVYYSEQGSGRYGVTYNNGDVWGGAAIQGKNGVDRFGFSYKEGYGITGVNVNYGNVRGSTYRGTNGFYGGDLYLGSRQMSSFTPYRSHYGGVYEPSYFGNSVYP